MSDDYDTCILEYTIHAEYQQLVKHNIPDLYVIPSASSSLIWYGVIFIHQGIYQGGVFRFTLFLPDNFPDECPRIIFNPIVYHPLISAESGELDVKQYISNWKRNIHHIYQVLFYVRRIFYQIDTKNASNLEAARLYENENDEFKRCVEKCIAECDKKIYETPPINADDAHSIKFSKLDDEAYKSIRESMINMLNDN